jgi:WD40 repeat protein
LLLAARAVQRAPNSGVAADTEAALTQLLARPHPQLMSAIKAHGANAWSVALAAGGKLFATTGCDERVSASACASGQVRLWDENGNALGEFGARAQDITIAAISPDETRVLTADMRGRVEVWDAETRARLFSLDAYTRSLNSAAFSPTGDTILTVGYGSVAHMWDKGGALLGPLEENGALTLNAQHSRNGERIVTSHCRAADNGMCVAGSARLWDRAGELLLRIADGAPVNHAATDATGARIATGECAEVVEGRCLGGRVRLWDTTGAELVAFGQNLYRTPILHLEFDLTGGRIFAMSRREAAIWNRNGSLIARLDRGELDLWHGQFSPDGMLVLLSGTRATATAANTNLADVTLWDADGRFLTELPGHLGIVAASAFSLDRSRALTAGLDGEAHVWDISSVTPGLQLSGVTAWPRMVAYSPNGERIVATAPDGLRIWDRDGRLIAHLERSVALVSAVRFNPEGTMFAAFVCEARTEGADCRRGALRLYDLDGRKLRDVPGYRFPGGFDMSPADDRVVVAAAGNAAAIVDGAGNVVATLAEAAAPLTRLAYSPDGKRIAGASEDHRVRVWDADGRLLQTIEGHTAPARGAKFSPDGSLLLTYGDDFTLRLWDAEGQLVRVLTGAGAGIKYAEFNRDG